MNKKLIGVGVGIALLVSPLLASAQTTDSSNSSIIASLQQLIFTLTQELQQLLAIRSSSTSSKPVTVNSSDSEGNEFIPGSLANICASYVLKKGDTDDATGGKVTQLQSYLGINPTTGYYGAQTAIAFQNKCGNLSNAQPTSVAGMTKYTDSDFGFSFWYPIGWSVTNTSAGGAGYSGDSLVKELQVTNGTKSVNLYEFHSPSGILYSGGKAFERVYFDANTGMWMDHDSNTSQAYYDPSKATKPADISINTMGGLHLIWDSVVPLSANDFVVVDTYGRDDPAVSLAKTIVATNPAVAIPVSTSQQSAIILAEASAYGTQAQSQETIFYGSRVGMVVNVLSKTGLDTSHAVISTQHTRDNAIAFCRDYVLSVTESCIQDELAANLATKITADCTTGGFTDFFGNTHQFLGANASVSESGGNYRIKDVATGQYEDNSSASGYLTNLSLYRALCPGEAPPASSF